MSRTLLTLLIVIGMFFPVWGPAIYLGILKKRFPMDRKYSNSIEGTVKLWALNIGILDIMLALAFLRGMASDIEVRTQTLAEGFFFVWMWGKWVLGTILIGNFLLAASVIAEIEKDSDPDVITVGSYILAILLAAAAAIVYVGWKIAFAITTGM